VFIWVKGASMNQTNQPNKSWRRLLLIIPLGLISLCLVIGGVLLISNQFLPEPSTTPDELTHEDIARAEEALNLLANLGNQTWPGFDHAIPLIVWNDSYAFLINAEEKLPDWEELENVSINDLPVYTQVNTANYQAFTEVLINNQYAGSMATKDATNIKFIQLFKDNLPPVLAQLFPYQLILISSDHYITALVHETFHAFQAENYPIRFEDADEAYPSGSAYESSFPEMSEAWQSEVQILIDALQTDDQSIQIERVKDFLDSREDRRSKAGLGPNLVLYEKRFEWLEGSAKYVELEIWRLAASSPDYKPAEGIKNDKDFDGYEKYLRHWKNELTSMKNAAKSGGDTLFYYSGMLQARLLDQLMPNWKLRVGEPGVWMEDLLRESID
jgi:hypothetical protein